MGGEPISRFSRYKNAFFAGLASLARYPRQRRVKECRWKLLGSHFHVRQRRKFWKHWLLSRVSHELSDRRDDRTKVESLYFARLQFRAASFDHACISRLRDVPLSLDQVEWWVWAKKLGEQRTRHRSTLGFSVSRLLLLFVNWRETRWSSLEFITHFSFS